MVGSGPRQASPHHAKSAGSERQDDFLNLKRERDRERYPEGSVHTSHTSRSHSRVGSHVSQRQNSNKAMQLEIDYLKKKLGAVHNGNKLPTILIRPLVIKRMIIIGEGQELH